MRISLGVAAALATGLACLPKTSASGVSQIEAPPGFKVSLYAQVPGARSLALGPDGTLFVGTMRDKVYAVRDTDGDRVGDKVSVVASGLDVPNGVAVRGNDLYVAEVSRILAFKDIVRRLDNPGKPKVISDRYPDDRAHGWKFIGFGPDGMLYVPVGAPCNICEPDLPYSTITRMRPDGSGYEVVARGVRNSVGFDWHPSSKELWFTDNGRDYLGDDKPPCELNRVTAVGQHFGYPYCHGGDIPDPEFGSKRKCSEFRSPAHRLVAHAAPVGMRFYRGGMFPPEYRGRILVAEHGSWNRSRKVGYRVMQARLDDKGSVVAYEPFLEGFLDEKAQEAWGRPVDLQELPDGSVLVSDDAAGAVYRVTYAGKKG